MEGAAIFSSSHTKLLPKTVQGSDDDNEAKETEEIKGEIIASKRYLENNCFGLNTR